MYEFRNIGGRWEHRLPGGEWSTLDEGSWIGQVLADVTAVRTGPNGQEFVRADGSVGDFTWLWTSAYALRDGGTEGKPNEAYPGQLSHGRPSWWPERYLDYDAWEALMSERYDGDPAGYQQERDRMWEATLNGSVDAPDATSRAQVLSGRVRAAPPPTWWRPEYGDYGRATPTEVEARKESAISGTYGQEARDAALQYAVGDDKRTFAKPETYVDPESGQRFYRSAATDAWHPIQQSKESARRDAILSLDEQIDEAIIKGDLDYARALANVRDTPTKKELFDIAMQFAKSPGDSMILQNIQRGLSKLDKPEGELGVVPRPSGLLEAYAGLQADPYADAALRGRQGPDMTGLTELEASIAAMEQQLAALKGEPAQGPLVPQSAEAQGIQNAAFLGGQPTAIPTQPNTPFYNDPDWRPGGEPTYPMSATPSVLGGLPTAVPQPVPAPEESEYAGPYEAYRQQLGPFWMTRGRGVR